jgi:hypothetical protein
MREEPEGRRERREKEGEKTSFSSPKHAKS